MKRITILIAFLLWAPSAWALTEIPGNGIDDDAAGGDQACASPDADCDGYTTDGTGLGYDCDDTNRRIFPGVEVSVTQTTWKTCQTNGTYGSTGSVCPSGTCYFIDPTSGSNANAGTTPGAAFQTLTMVSYYVAGAPAGNVHSSLACGDHIYLLPGTYNAGQGHNMAGGVLYNIVGLLLYNKTTCTSNNYITIHFLGAAIIDTIGTSTAGTDGVALAIDNSPYTRVKGNTAGEIKTIYSAGGGGIETGAVKVQTSDFVQIQNLYLHDNIGNGDSNSAAIYLGSSSDVTIDHNRIYDQINNAGNVANECLLVGFHGTNQRVKYNVLGYTSGATAYCGVKWKHNNTASNTCRFDHNLVSKSPGFISACANNTFDHNIFADGDCTNAMGCGADACAPTEVCDTGGPHLDGNQVIQYNTVYSTLTGLNARLFNWDPISPFAGTATVTRNVYRDQPLSYSAQAGIENVAPYGADATYTAVITGGKYSTTNNCYYNSAATTTTWSFFGNNGSTALGNSYDFSGLTGAGFCAGCQNGTNPTFNTKLEATAGSCAGVAGWNVGWLEASSSSTSATTGTAHLINQCLRRHR